MCVLSYVLTYSTSRVRDNHSYSHVPRGLRRFTVPPLSVNYKRVRRRFAFTHIRGILTYLLAYLLTYLLTCLLSRCCCERPALNTYLLTYIITCLLAYLLTYLLAYFLTYLPTYLRTCCRRERPRIPYLLTY